MRQYSKNLSIMDFASMSINGEVCPRNNRAVAAANSGWEKQGGAPIAPIGSLGAERPDVRFNELAPGTSNVAFL